jgi:hypothetical protein
VKQLRIGGLFLANLFAAVMGTAIVESAIPFRSNLGLLLTKEFVVAFALGYFGYRLLKSSTAKWVWLAGFGWFASRAIALWLNQSAVRTMTGSYALAIPSSDWILYGTTFSRTVFYSAGALLPSRVSRTPPLDAEGAPSDHDSNAHAAPPSDVHDPLRADSSQRMD